MPIVRVEMFSGRTHEQKAEMAQAITDSVANIAQIPPEAVIVIFTDVPREHWAQAGKLASEPAQV
jgi:4-oxalocrotonate tautomerase